MFGCEKFHHYLYGRNFVAETDHKPLGIIMKKLLHLVPMRLQRMRIRLQRYNVTVQYKPRKSIPVADTLSRKGARDGSAPDDLGLDVYVDVILKQMPVSMRSWNKFVTQVKTTVNCRSFKSMFNKGGQIHRKTCSNDSSVLQLSRRDHRN